MNPYDAAALFWFARNMNFFENDLEKNQDVIMIKYEDLVQKPAAMMEELYKSIGLKFPGPRVVSDVHQNSIGKGRTLKFSVEVDKLCDNLYGRLNEAYKSQNASKI